MTTMMRTIDQVEVGMTDTCVRCGTEIDDDEICEECWKELVDDCGGSND